MTNTAPSPAPLRFALVPAESTVYMDVAGRRALSDNGCDNVEDSDAEKCYHAMLAANPGNDLLQRIVRALNLGSTSLRNDGYIYAADGFDEILAELRAIAAAQPFTET